MSDAVASGSAGSAPSRTTDERLQESPFFGPLHSAWDIARLGGKVAKAAITPPYSWFGDAVGEANANFNRCLVPLIISQAIWLTGFGILNFGEVAALLGVSDRHPGGVFVGYVREVASWVTMMILAGVAGSALAADLGSRKIREELDALAVLGVDMTRKLIVPRVVAMIFCSVVLGLLGLLIAVLTNFAFGPSFLEFPDAVYWESVTLNIIPTDIYASMIKHAIIGLMLGLVACQKGLATKGGAEGVGRTVNQTVVVSFVGIWAINSLYNVAVLTLFPDLSVQRG